MEYVMLDKTHLRDRETNKIVHLDNRVSGRDANVDIDVPFYFWRFKEGHLHEGPDAVYHKVFNVELNCFGIKFSMGFRHCALDFYDNARQLWTGMTIDAHPTLINAGMRYAQVTGMNYNVYMEAQTKEYFTKFDMYNQQFHQISGLDAQHVPEYAMHKFCMGVLAEQYSIYFQGKKLNGMSYAMLCGPYAFLLDDNLMFDSFALLKGAEYGRLCVSQFIYTVNPYILKLRFLSGGS